MNASTVTLSPSAAARISAIAERQAKPAILRLSVEGAAVRAFSTSSIWPMRRKPTTS
jgi:Fe-S cluster assembly iron-binding protein IscA